MPFLKDTGKVIGEFFDPANFGKFTRTGWSDMGKSVKDIASGAAFSSPAALGSTALRFPLMTVLPAMEVYDAVRPRADLDAAGPMEETARRGFGLYSALALASTKWPTAGVLPSIAGLIGANMLGHFGSKHIGRLADKAIGMNVTPNELMGRFGERIQSRAADIQSENPNLPMDQVNRHAMQQLFQEVPEYLELFQNSGKIR